MVRPTVDTSLPTVALQPRAAPVDTYVRPAQDNTAGGDLMDIARSLAGFSKPLGDLVAQRDQKAKDEDSAVKAIQSGEADAFFYDAPYTAPIINRAPILLKEAIVYPADDAPIGFVMQKGDKRKEQVDGALEQMILDGNWLKIKKEYFKEYPLSEVFKDKGA